MKMSNLSNFRKLFFIGIIGLSFVNSIFVDAMAEDNNDKVIEQLNKIEKKLEEIDKKIKQ